MSLAAELQAIRAEIEQLKRSRRSGKRRQVPLAVRIDPETDAIVRQLAKQRGVSLGTIMREALAYVVSQCQTDLSDNPAKFLPHRKPDHFHDGKTPRIKDPARDPIAEGYARSGMLIEAGAAVAMRAPAVEGKLSETVARPVVPRIVPKPSR